MSIIFCTFAAEFDFLPVSGNWFLVIFHASCNTCLRSKSYDKLVNKDETADRQHLTQAVHNIIEEDTPRFARLLSHVPERQQSLLFAIAKEGRVQKIMSGAFLRKYHLMSSSAVQNAIKHLLDFDLVTQDEKKQYVVYDIFLRMYLNKISEG